MIEKNMTCIEGTFEFNVRINIRKYYNSKYYHDDLLLVSEPGLPPPPVASWANSGSVCCDVM
jgi:hypothetical protein